MQLVKRFRRGINRAMLLLMFLPTALSITGPDLAQSAAVPAADIVSAVLKGNQAASDVLTSLGVLSPQEGADFAYLSTGRVGQSPEPGQDLPPMGKPQGDRSTVILNLTAPSNANSFAFDFYFLSAEYPEFVGSAFNDEFVAQVTGSAWSGNAALDSSGNSISVNSALFSVTQSSQLSGTGFDNGVGGGTGWLTVVIPATPGDTITLVLSIYDVTDGVYDSGVLVDDFYWSETEITTPIIVSDVDIDFLTPKRGPVAGGVTTTVVGSGFNESCSVTFDNVDAVSTTLVSATELLVEVPPHAPDLVDVKVACIGIEDELIGGYTYYDEDSGEIPPLIEGVEPYQLDVLGGETVLVIGQDFQEGLELRLDNDILPVTFIDSGSFEFESPEHAEGLADLQVTNPSGLVDLRSGAVLFVAQPTWPPEETGVIDSGGMDTGGTETGPGKLDGCGCTAQPQTAPWFGALLVPLLVLFRRRT
jgi:hypothetical protein